MKMSKLLSLFYKVGAFDLIRRLTPNRLTVLAYHRIDDFTHPDFDTFKPNVSATPAEFARQIAYLRHRFNLISIDQLVAWLRGDAKLPKYAALITFDDGYRDNFQHALPILQAAQAPGVVFLATDYIGQARPFFWDLVAYVFFYTAKTEVNLPGLGLQHWTNDTERTLAMDTWLAYLKTLSDVKKWAAVYQLPDLLGVSVPDDAFARLTMTWDEVRKMIAAGVQMGAHTQSHPILTRVLPDQARAEIAGSKARIEAETGQSVYSFAYPNGLTDDFNLRLQTLLPTLGIEAAFTLLPGPAKPAEVRGEPTAIRRVFVGNRDTLPRFAAKVTGLPRMLGLPR